MTFHDTHINYPSFNNTGDILQRDLIALSHSLALSQTHRHTHTHTLRTHEELSVVSGMFKVFNNFSPNLISSVLCFMFYILSLATYHVINTYISIYHDYFFSSVSNITANYQLHTLVFRRFIQKALLFRVQRNHI